VSCQTKCEHLSDEDNGLLKILHPTELLVARPEMNGKDDLGFRAIWVSCRMEREHISVEHDGLLEIFYLSELVVSRDKMGSKGSQGSCSLAVAAWAKCQRPTVSVNRLVDATSLPCFLE
jgi:hypothetical protein